VAEFEYINMDVCIERALKLADRLNQEALAGEPRAGVNPDAVAV
jgi:hypothetical protein